MYEGVGIMIMTDPNRESPWEQCVRILDEIGEEEMKNKTSYESTFLNGSRIRQPILSLPDLFIRALFSQERLDFEMTRLAKMTYGKLYVDSGVKSMLRTKEKKANETPKNNEVCVNRTDFNVWDFSRAMLSFGNLDQIIDAIRTLKDKTNFPQIEIINFTNRFKVKPPPRWTDVMVHVVFLDDPLAETPKDRLINEIQFSLWTMTMTRKDLGGHDAYAKFRCAVELEKYVKWKMNLMDDEREHENVDVNTGTETH